MPNGIEGQARDGGGAQTSEEMDFGPGAFTSEGLALYLRKMYENAWPLIPSATIAVLVSAAIDCAREKHADFEALCPLVWCVAMTVFPYPLNCPLGQYIEIVYQAAHHADFMQEGRAILAERALSIKSLVQ
jgi:hypothetical protein